ncbi:hypothetical protein GF324_05870 [bacterium]|nr:hypothetical protein [bacterium]
MRHFAIIAIFLLLIGTTGSAHAVVNDGKTYGIGIAGGLGVSGISGTIDTGSPTSFQLIAGTGVLGKLRYALHMREYWDIYVDAFGGIHTEWDDALVAGGGVGIDWNWQNLEPSLPPISFALEINAGIIDGDFEVDPHAGIHFNFNL